MKTNQQKITLPYADSLHLISQQFTTTKKHSTSVVWFNCMLLQRHFCFKMLVRFVDVLQFFFVQNIHFTLEFLMLVLLIFVLLKKPAKAPKSPETKFTDQVTPTRCCKSRNLNRAFRKSTKS